MSLITCADGLAYLREGAFIRRLLSWVGEALRHDDDAQTASVLWKEEFRCFHSCHALELGALWPSLSV